MLKIYIEMKKKISHDWKKKTSHDTGNKRFYMISFSLHINSTTR